MATPDLCTECLASSEYQAFAQLALANDEALRASFGREDLPPGAVLFLGKHYSHSKTILFTLNPTPHAADLPQAAIETQLFRTGIHWDGNPNARHRNWTGGRLLFNAMLESAPWFQPQLDKATDAFIVPWPSRDWAAMRRSPSWPAIRDRSRSLFTASLRHHQPNLVFTTGKIANDLFWQFLGTPKPKPVDARRSRASSNWDSELFRLEGLRLPGVTLPTLNVFRLPHFSRFSRKEFKSVGQWVAERLPTTDLA